MLISGGRSDIYCSVLVSAVRGRRSYQKYKDKKSRRMTLDVYLSKELPDKEPPNTVFSVLQNGCLTGQAPIKALNKLLLSFEAVEKDFYSN